MILFHLIYNTLFLNKYFTKILPYRITKMAAVRTNVSGCILRF